MPRETVHRVSRNSSEREQKRKQGFLFRQRQLFERIGNFGGFTAVAANGVCESRGPAVVHEARVKTYAPEWRSADLVCRAVELGKRGALQVGMLGKSSAVVLWYSLHDTVASTDVVKQKVSVRMKSFVAKSGRYGEVTPVNGSA